MGNNSKKAKRNAVLLVLYQMITISFGLLIPRITITGYSSEVNGLLNSVNQIISYLILFEAGIQAVAKKTLYKTIAENDVSGTNSIISAVNKNYKRIGTYYLSCLLIFALIYPIFTVSKTLDFLTVFLIVFFSGIGNVVSFYFQGKYQILLEADGKSYILTTISMIITITNQLVKIILLLNAVDIKYVIAATTAIGMSQIIFVYYYINKNYKWISLKENPNFSALKQSKYAFIHQVSAQIFAHTDVLLLTFILRDLKVVSIYTVYKMVVYYIRTVLAIPYDSTIFAMGQLYNTDRKKYIRYVDGLQLFMSVSVFALFTITFFLLLPFMKLYTRGADISYIEEKWALLLPFMFVFAEILNIIRSPMNSTINFAGHFKETVWRSILETGINLTVSVAGVYFFGIKGALLGTIVALLYRTNDIVIYTNRRLLNRSPFKTLSTFVLNFILFVSIGLYVSSLNVKVSSYFDFLRFAVISSPIVIIIFVVINLAIYKNERRLLFDILKKKLLKQEDNDVAIQE